MISTYFLLMFIMTAIYSAIGREMYEHSSSVIISQTNNLLVLVFFQLQR